MKNAPTTISNESAPDKRNYTCGIRPRRVNTLTADVLVYMLEGHTSTGMEAVFGNSTTRLAAVIHYLAKEYGWDFETCSRVVGTKDGRETWISVYWLARDVIETAFNDGARAWIESVKEASASRRKRAAKCRARAAAKNKAMRRRDADPRQGNLLVGL